MGADRYTSEHKNLTRNEVTWRIEIFDSLGSPVGTFSIAGQEGVMYQEQGAGQDPLPGIYPTSVSINFLVENAQAEFMIEDIRNLDRSRFSVKIYHDGVLDFIGRFASHNITFENAPMPYAVRLTAEDGLANLKNDTYSNTITNGYSGQDTFLEHIKKCFDGIDLQGFYSGDMIDFTVNWHNSLMVDITSNPLENSRVDHKTFKKNNDDFLSRWDVLKRICTGWGARLYYAEGRYHFEQLSERSDATFRRFVYDSAFVETASSGDLSIEQELDKTIGTSVMEGGVFGLLDNLKSVDVLLKVDTGNLGEGLEWSHLDETQKSVGTIKIEDVTDLLSTKWSFDYQTIPTDPNITQAEWIDHRFELKITLIFTNVTTVATSYAERSIIYTNIYVLQHTSINFITATPNNWFQAFDVQDYPERDVIISENFVQGLYALSHQGSVDDLIEITMQVELSQVRGANDADLSVPPHSADYTFNWWIRNFHFEVLSESGSAQQTIEIHHIATNTLEAERKLEINSFFGDLANKKNGIQVYDGTDWIYSGKTWGIDTLAGTKAFALLLAHEILMIRLTSKDLYHGAVILHNYRRDARIEYDSKFWIPLKGSIARGKDIFQGTLLEIDAEDVSGVTEDEVDVTEAPPPVLTDNPNNDPPPIFTPNPSDLVTNEILDTAAPFTVIDVINTAGIELDSGEYVLITSLATGLTEIVQLTAALLSGSTTITIASYTFTNEFSIGSPIVIAPIIEFEWVEQILTGNGTDNFVTVTGPISDPAAFTSDRTYFRWMEVHRGSSRLHFTSSATSAMSDGQFGVVQATERVTLPDSWTLANGEQILIYYKIPRY